MSSVNLLGPRAGARRRATAGRRRQSGFSLLAAAALAALLGLLAFVVYSRWQVNQLAADRLAQDQLLDKADAVTRGFAALKGRLPCPAATYGGNEQCDGTLAKGWFPANAATLFAPTEVAERLKGLRYYADARLTNVKDVFPPDPHNAAIVNGHDFCRTLVLIDPGLGGVDGGLPGSAGVRKPVVYGFAAPGPSGFTGSNASAALQLEDEDREQNAIYRERVRAGSARSLAMASNCGAIIASLNMLTIAAQWNSAMPDARTVASFDYNRYTIWPMANALAMSQIMAVDEVASFATETAALIGGLAASEAKDDSACAASFGLYWPACAAGIVQGIQLGLVAIQSVTLALDVLALEARVVGAIIELTKNGSIHRDYDMLDIWKGQNDVLLKVDQLGPLIWEEGP